MTNPVGDVAVYTIGRDPGNDKPRIEMIEGECPTCGLGPNSQLLYEDAGNPLLPTWILDGNGNETQFSYDANGQITMRVEAASDPLLSRTTSWAYDPSFPAFPTSIERPSTSGTPNLRFMSASYDATGDKLDSTIAGMEDGAPFSLTATYTHAPSGKIASIDPPGFGATDQTTFTYDPARGHLIPLSMTEPLVGSTTWAHDDFNRRSSITDPNGVVTLLEYDALDRLTRVVRKGKRSSEDLVTEQTYTVFGDLFRTILPEGNIVERSYDAAERLTRIERKPELATPGERAVMSLNGAGRRTRLEFQRWDGANWVVESFDDFVYLSDCQLDRVVRADGSVVEYAYDMQDHIARVTDAEGNETTFTYGDRDLMTQEVSPVTGRSLFVYNEHGALTQSTDGRGVTVTRQVDVLDRTTLEDYADNSLDTTWTYDDPAVNFSRGRLTRVDRGNGTVRDLRYDRFGRVTVDGELSFAYDRNGNVIRIDYPRGVAAAYTYDFADRQATLGVRRAPGGGFSPIVTASSYKAFGPLSSLTFANGVTETRSFGTREFPVREQRRLGRGFRADHADPARPAGGRLRRHDRPGQRFAAGQPWRLVRRSRRLADRRRGSLRPGGSRRDPALALCDRQLGTRRGLVSRRCRRRQYDLCLRPVAARRGLGTRGWRCVVPDRSVGVGLRAELVDATDRRTASDYVLYATSLGALGSEPQCDGDLGSGSGAIRPALPDDSAFVVVARNAIGEGSYGRDSSGASRLQASGNVCP